MTDDTLSELFWNYIRQKTRYTVYLKSDWCLRVSVCRALELHVLTRDAWFSDGVAYPRLSWLSADLLPKLQRWATECKSSEFRSTLSLLPVEKYSVMYQQLKEKYKALVKVKTEGGPALHLYHCLRTCVAECWCLPSSPGLARGHRSWEVCLWGRRHRYVSSREFF